MFGRTHLKPYTNRFQSTPDVVRLLLPQMVRWTKAEASIIARILAGRAQELNAAIPDCETDFGAVPLELPREPFKST